MLNSQPNLTIKFRSVIDPISKNTRWTEVYLRLTPALKWLLVMTIFREIWTNVYQPKMGNYDRPKKGFYQSPIWWNNDYPGVTIWVWIRHCLQKHVQRHHSKTQHSMGESSFRKTVTLKLPSWLQADWQIAISFPGKFLPLLPPWKWRGSCE